MTSGDIPATGKNFLKSTKVVKCGRCKNKPCNRLADLKTALIICQNN